MFDKQFHKEELLFLEFLILPIVDDSDVHKHKFVCMQPHEKYASICHMIWQINAENFYTSGAVQCPVQCVSNKIIS